MQTLPPDVLRNIWGLLHNARRPRDCTDQWALRCTCRALRQATAPLIFSLRIRRSAPHFEPELGEDVVDEHPEDVFLGCHLSMQQFPSDAVLRNLDVDGMCPKTDLLPSLVLQCLTSSGDAKLACLQSLKLRMVEIDVGAVSSIVLACPQLQELAISSSRLIGPVLVPLAHLPSLRTVTLEHCRPWIIDPRLWQTVSGLTQVTKLKLLLDADVDDESRCEWDDFLPQVTKLQQLCSLGLNILPDDLNDVRCLEPLTALSRLTCLCLDTSYHPLPLTPACNPFLALSSLKSLVSLKLPEADLTTALAHTLSVLPHLTHLSGDRVEEGADLSPLAGSLRSLTMHRCNSLEALAALHPLTSLTRFKQHHGFLWMLEASERAHDKTCRLNKIVDVLNRGWHPRRDSEHHMNLGCWSFALLYFASGPSQRSHLALAPLAPLNRLRSDLRDLFVLALDSRWDVSAAHAQQLDMYLPLLRQLRVYPDGPSFATFAGALGSSLINLRTLMICFPIQERGLPGGVTRALLAMAAARAGNRLPLKVKHYGCQMKGKGVHSWLHLVSAAARQQRDFQLPDLVQVCLTDDE